MTTDYGFGFEAGKAWIGPNGDGSFGNLSLDFIDEQAQEFAAGRRFSELTDGPSPIEELMADNWLRGFLDGAKVPR